MAELSPSILSADFAILGEQVAQVEKAGAEYLHIDVMDGSFVPDISYGLPVIRSLRKASGMVFDVHLMMEEPLLHISDFANAGADIITVHVEACRHLNRTIRKIKEKGKKAGVALNPATSLSTLDYILDEVDIVQIMSVNPGFANQVFIPSALKKVSDAKKMLIERGALAKIEVDGGVNLKNAKEIIEAGADILVAGSAIFNQDISANVKAFKEVFRQCS